MSVAASADRRAVLGSSLALASTLAASATAATAVADPKHPDAVLLALGREWQACILPVLAAREAIAQAAARYGTLPVPEAAYQRDGDDFRGLQVVPGADGRWHYVMPALIRQALAQFEAEAAHRPAAQARLDRLREVADAVEGWAAENTRRNEASGMTAAEEAQERALDYDGTLEPRIIATPALTLEGILLKARVVLWKRYDTVAELEEAVEGDRQSFLHESQADNALLLDLLRLGSIVHAGGTAEAGA